MKGNLDVRWGRSIAIGSFPFRPGDETCPNSHRLRKRPNNRDSRDSLPLPAAFQRFPAAGIWSQPRNLALALRFDEPCSRRFLRLWLIYKQTENNLSERWRRTEGEGGRERWWKKRERETETGPQDVLFWLGLASPLPLKKYYSNSFGSSRLHAARLPHTRFPSECPDTPSVNLWIACNWIGAVWLARRNMLMLWLPLQNTKTLLKRPV